MQHIVKAKQDLINAMRSEEETSEATYELLDAFIESLENEYSVDINQLQKQMKNFKFNGEYNKLLGMLDGRAYSSVASIECHLDEMILTFQLYVGKK